MSEPTRERIKAQLRESMRRYSDDEELQCALLSGVSLTATFLAKLEGGSIRPQDVASAAAEVGQEMGWGVTKMPKE